MLEERLKEICAARNVRIRPPYCCLILVIFSAISPFSSTATADLSVTVSSNEAQHIQIQKSLTQQVLIGISPAG
jgi:hypothetical protein